MLDFLNKTYQGSLLIYKGGNYLVNEFFGYDNSQKLINVYLIDYKGRKNPMTCTYDEFLEDVVR